MGQRGRARRWWIWAIAAGLLGLGGAMLYFDEITEYLARGPARDARKAPESRAPAARRQLLIVAIDGAGRAPLYDLLRAGKLPHLAHLLGGDGLAHAHLDETVLSVMPSTTIPAWASFFTGEPPGVHGITGNEFFAREATWLVAPAPVSFNDHEVVMSVYTDDTAEKYMAVPTIYERMRRTSPGARIWVSMSQFYRGADRILSARRAVLAEAFLAFVEEVTGDDPRGTYAQLDDEAMETVDDTIDEDGVPDVLTVYLPGLDLYAHASSKGPDEARRGYLIDVLDPQMERLARKLDERGALADRFVVVVSDHGHTGVPKDDAHALEAEGDDEPPAVLRAAGFRVRDFAYHTGPAYDTVMAFGGSTAYVYLADRSMCPPDAACPWARPPRWDEDVLAAAEALHAANRGTGWLDLILVRRPRAVAENDEPFLVYQGGGRLAPLGQHLRPDWVAAEERLADLATGPRGERAGDIMLITREGYYFSRPYHSWHGSPTRRDSEVAFIVAHRGRTAAELRAIVSRQLGPAPRLHHAGRAVLALFAGTEQN